jgi:hypothetical protein
VDDLEALSDRELLEGLAGSGEQLLTAAREQLAAMGDVPDDERWTDSPLPLRFELQMCVLFLGALDAYAATTHLLRARVSQQSFGSLRFQMESLALINWMTKSPDTAERRLRAYKVVCGQLTRWGKILKEDADKDRDALDGVHHIRNWARRLRQIAAEDGIHHLKQAPKVRELFGYLDEKQLGSVSGHPMWSLLSELGSHPGAAGLTLFSVDPLSSKISYDMTGAEIPRANWITTSIVLLWQTCQSVSKGLGWEQWLLNDAGPAYAASAPLILEVRGRRESAS